MLSCSAGVTSVEAGDQAGDVGRIQLADEGSFKWREAQRARWCEEELFGLAWPGWCSFLLSEKA